MISHAIGGGKYIRKASLSLGAVILVSGTEQFGQLLRSHQPSTSAILVPLVEQEYILFILSWGAQPFMIQTCDVKSILGILLQNSIFKLQPIYLAIFLSNFSLV